MTDIPPRWYCVDRHGMTTLCADEDNARAEAAENDIRWPRNAPHTAVQLAPVPAKPTITPEQARDAQHWAGMDGATAWHLIDRHADGWGDVGVMMDAWLQANRAPVPAQGAEGGEALADRLLAYSDAEDILPGERADLQEAARRLRNSPESPDGSAREDAERWRYLEPRMVSASFEGDAVILGFELPENSRVWKCPKKTIDAARSAGEMADEA